MMSLSIRPAVKSDYHDVIAIRVDDSMDYLFGSYLHMTDDPSWSGFIVQKDNKVVGYSGYHMIDNGQSMMHRASRVQQDLRGTGIMTFATRKMRAHYPRTAMFSKSTIKSNSPIVGASPIVFKRGISSYKIKVDEKHKRSDISSQNDRLINIDKSQMLDIISDKKNCRRLFPCGFISVRWTFLDLIPENLSFIERFSDHKYATFSQDGVCRTLTLSVHYPCSNGYVYHMECYGDTSRETLLSHVRVHAKHALQLAHGEDLKFCVYTWLEEFQLNTWLDEVMGSIGFDVYKIDYNCYIGQMTRMKHQSQISDSSEYENTREIKSNL